MHKTLPGHAVYPFHKKKKTHPWVLSHTKGLSPMLNNLTKTWIEIAGRSESSHRTRYEAALEGHVPEKLCKQAAHREKKKEKNVMWEVRFRAACTYTQTYTHMITHILLQLRWRKYRHEHKFNKTQVKFYTLRKNTRKKWTWVFDFVFYSIPWLLTTLGQRQYLRRQCKPHDKCNH